MKLQNQILIYAPISIGFGICIGELVGIIPGIICEVLFIWFIIPIIEVSE